MVDANLLGNTANAITNVIPIQGNYYFIGIGIILIIITIIILLLLKKALINSILGIIGFIIIQYIFGIKLPFIPTIVISIIFGLAGLGTMIVLKVFGIL